MDAEHECAERALAAPVPARVAGDHELLALLGLDLQPLPAPPSRVTGVGPLGEDTLEALLLRGLEQRLAVVEHRRELDGRVLVYELLQPRVPLLERQVDERLALELEQVEEVVDERPRPLLHRREARAPLLVERADLAVEHAVGGAKRARERPRHLLESRSEVVAVPARERHLSPADAGERTEAVPLHLEQPAGAVRRVLGGGGEHGPVLAPFRRRLDAAVLADQQPVLGVPTQLRGHERPEPVEPLPVQLHREAAVAFLLDELVRAVVPDLDRPGPVLAGRDPPLEGRVVERVILDVHRQHALPRLERDSLRHGPAQEHTVALQAKVVVEAPRRVPLDDESQRLALAVAAERLGRDLRIALAAVLAQLRGCRPGQMRCICGLQGLFRPGENPVDSVEFPAKPLCEHT